MEEGQTNELTGAMTASGPGQNAPEQGVAGREQGAAGRSSHARGVVIAVVAVAAAFAVLVTGVRSLPGLGYEPAAVAATSGPEVTLQTFPDSMVCHGSGGGPHSARVTYCPSTSIRVPAHSTVTVTIYQYDTATRCTTCSSTRFGERSAG